MRPLGLVSSVLLLVSAPSGLGPSGAVVDPAPPQVLVTVGEVGPDRAALWARVAGGEPARVEYAPADGGAPARSVELRPDPARDLTGRVTLGHLRPATRYAYRLRAGAETVEGSFATAPAPEDDAVVRLAWSGDLGGAGHCRDVEDGYRIFAALAARRPDLFLFVGDTIYADQPCGGAPHLAGADFVASTLDEFRAKHRYNRADRLVQGFFRRTPVFPVWDDHEVRNNFAGSVEPLMPVARQAFFDYWPVAGPPGEPHRLYRSVRWGRHVEIFILDTRQYRSANGAPDGEDKTMLGAAQRAWLLARLPASDATWKLVVSSVPLGMFTGGPAADSWSNANLLGFARGNGTGFVHERDRLLAALHARGVRNLVVLSGDVHHAELIRHAPFPGWAFHEFVAGPLAARRGYPLPLDRSLGSRSLASLGWAYNFGEIVADGRRLTVRIVDPAGTVRAAVTIPAERPGELPVAREPSAPRERREPGPLTGRASAWSPAACLQDAGRASACGPARH